MVGVDVGHETVARAIDTFADDAAVFFLALCVFVCNVPLEACFRAQDLATQLASKHFLQRAWKKITCKRNNGPKLYGTKETKKCNHEFSKRIQMVLEAFNAIKRLIFYSSDI